MRGLKICLWITGLLCLISIVGLILPLSAFESLAQWFGIEQLPDSPLTDYMVRGMCATFVAVGFFFIMLAIRPSHYLAMILFAGIATIFLGLICLATGIMVQMPTPWILGDTLPCLVLGILILIFRQKAITELNHPDTT